MNIVIDAMGGDLAPDEVVLGAVEASAFCKHTLILVGDAPRIQALLPKPCPSNIELHPASQVIEMHEKPLDALRKKKDSSLAVAIEMVRKGQGHCLVSAGNTGAVTAGCLLSWRQMHGFHRPAIASELPSRGRNLLLLDAGASPDVDPEHLVEFAHMGRAYARCLMGRDAPTVHLLNIGEEEGKGNAFTKQAYALLARHRWFAGNVEGKDLFSGECDVVVCDAFVGNIVLKTAEGAAELIVELIRKAIPKNPLARIAFLPARKVLVPLFKRLDYAEVGGSPLLGLNGICIICHGRSKSRAIKNALLLAERAVDSGLDSALRDSILAELEDRAS